MHRLLRPLFALLLALVAFASPARAAFAEGPELAEVPAGASAPPAMGPQLVAPHDVPVITSAAREIPPLPPSYVTRDLGWLRLSHPPGAEERVASLVRDANAVKAELSSALGHAVLEHVDVRIAPTASDMARLAPSTIPPPEYASGVAYTGMHFVLLSMLAPRGAEAVGAIRTSTCSRTA